MASLNTQEMNEWWKDDKEQSVSQSSMSLSKDIPSFVHGHINGLSLTAESNRNSNSNSISHSIAAQNEEKYTLKMERNILISKIVYDDKKFTKFEKAFLNNTKQSATHKRHKSLLSAPEIKRIYNSNEIPLCYKETIVSSHKELKRCVDEYKALKSFCSAYQGTELANKCVSLYINKKGSSSYPKKVRLVMKYYEGEDLDDFLVDEEDGEVGFLYEDDFRAIMKRILHQLSICHKQGIIHCDLKPHNIRIQQSDDYDDDHPEYYDVNIIDFGFSEILKEKQKDLKMTFIKGTPGYIAPETLKHKKYSFKSDMFSVGCVAFFLLTNKYAVIQSPDMDQEDMMPDRKRIKQLLQRENTTNRDDESKIDQGTIDFVLSCLWKNPVKRPTATQALSLPIFQ